MAMDGLRGYLQLASGLAEMSRARATEAASALLSLSSGLAGGRSSSAVQVQVQDLAEELLAAAAANRRSLIALVRSEVERAMARSPIPPDELDRARAAVAKLSADVEELRAQVLANPAVGEVASRLGLGGGSHTQPAETDVATRPPSSDDGVVVDAAFTGRLDETVDAPPRRRPPRRQISGAATRPVPGAVAEAPVSASEPRTETGATRTTARSRTTKGASTARKAAPASGAVTTKGATATKAATKKATPAKKSTAAKSAAKKAAATKTATTATPAKKSTAKSTATKSTATKRATTSTGTRSTAKRSTPTKATATKSTAKRATATKSAAPRAGGGS